MYDKENIKDFNDYYSSINDAYAVCLFGMYS